MGQSAIEAIEPSGGPSTGLHVIPFDKHGDCTGPRALEQLVDAGQCATDVFLFSHGWNNDWKTATTRYREFIGTFADVRRANWDPPSREYRPVLAGVFWPSTSLIAPWEKPPAIAGAPSDADDAAAALGDELDEAAATRVRELARRDALDETELRELAEIIAPLLGGEHDELDDQAPAPSPRDLLDIWAQAPLAGAPNGDEGGFIGDAVLADPAAAGVIKRADPRALLRLSTVLVMKDRAGRIGATGVAAMLGRLLAASSDSRLHLIGHSYGGKVVLSALCGGPPPRRPVESVLLLQPAMSALCFARDSDGTGRPGGYRSALERSRQPILTTFSRHDVPLTKAFQLAVRRKSDLGEARIAGAPPSRYAALGGFGPQGVGGEAVTVPALAPPQRYVATDPLTRVVAIQADAVIHGHGDVVNPATAWALLSQILDDGS